MIIFKRLYTILRWTIGSIFIYAGITKLIEPVVFATLIEAYGLLPEAMILPVAVMLPVLEIIAGIGLIFDIRGSLSLITILLILFIAVLSYGISMGLDIDCGCFGPGDPEAKAFYGLRTTLYRDVIIAATIAYLFLWRRIKKIEPAVLIKKSKIWRKENEI